MPKCQIKLPLTKIEEFCAKWQIEEFALFGSVLRDDFHEQSDIDILIDFTPNTKRSLSTMLQMQDELEEIFQRKIDLIVKSAIKNSENWLRRKNILESAQVIYVKGSRIFN